uniref:Uncharacterized protein n=1 Tax=Oryzias melastigma TaxID=30732 RepID=A0A3B3BCZ8_ORYME
MDSFLSLICMWKPADFFPSCESLCAGGVLELFLCGSMRVFPTLKRPRCSVCLSFDQQVLLVPQTTGLPGFGFQTATPFLPTLYGTAFTGGLGSTPPALPCVWLKPCSAVWPPAG